MLIYKWLGKNPNREFLGLSPKEVLWIRPLFIYKIGPTLCKKCVQKMKFKNPDQGHSEILNKKQNKKFSYDSQRLTFGRAFKSINFLVDFCFSIWIFCTWKLVDVDWVIRMRRWQSVYISTAVFLVVCDPSMNKLWAT